MKNRKLLFAIRCSFILFALYDLTYIILPFITHNPKDTIFLILPTIFTISLIINVLIKYDKVETNGISKGSKIASLCNILFNGFNLNTVSGSLYVGTMDWDAKKEQIKKYPSIEPAWLFVISVTTLLFNLPFAMLLDIDNIQLISIFVLVSIVLLILCQISSSFVLYYNNGKDEMKKFWRNIIIVLVGFVIILAFVFIPLIKDLNKENNNKKEYQEHINNINNSLNN